MLSGGAPEHAGRRDHSQAVGREVEHLCAGLLHETPDDPHPPPDHTLLRRLPQVQYPARWLSNEIKPPSLKQSSSKILTKVYPVR